MGVLPSSRSAASAASAGNGPPDEKMARTPVRAALQSMLSGSRRKSAGLVISADRRPVSTSASSSGYSIVRERKLRLVAIGQRIL